MCQDIKDMERLFNACLTCHDCVDNDWLIVETDSHYLPTPWQGKICNNVKVLFIGINPSQTPSDQTDIFDKAEAGYSIKFAEYDSLKSEEDKHRLLGCVYKSLADPNIRRRNEEIFPRTGKPWPYFPKIASLLLGHDLNDIECYSDYILTDFIHCQTQRAGDLGGYEDVGNIGAHCFAEHTAGFLQLLDNLKWIVVCGDGPRKFFTQNREMVFGPFNVDETTNLDQEIVYHTTANGDALIGYKNINRDLKLLLLPFPGVGQWKGNWNKRDTNEGVNYYNIISQIVQDLIV